MLNASFMIAIAGFLMCPIKNNFSMDKMEEEINCCWKNCLGSNTFKMWSQLKGKN